MKRHTRAIALALGVFLAGAGGAQELDLDANLTARQTQGCAVDVTAPPPNSRAASNATKLLPPSNGTYVGAYQIPVEAADVTQFANATGVFPPVVYSFHDFFAETNYGKTPDLTLLDKMEGSRSQPPLVAARWLAERGSFLSFSWAIYCCDINATAFWFRLRKPHEHINRILAGEHDDFIRQSARQIRDAGVPVMINLVPEFNWQGQFIFGADGRTWMDGTDNICAEYGDPSWPDGPERIRDLHRRVIDIFRQEGANNVTWMMYAANAYMAGNRDFEGQSRWLHPKYFYPGDAYIDWVGQSVYYTAEEWIGNYSEIGTFEDVFLPGYRAWRSVTSKPIMIPEFGIVAEAGADRSALWHDLFRRQLKSVPGVKAVTIGDSPVFRDYFELPMLSPNPTERAIVAGYLASDGYYRNGVRVGRPR